MHALPLAAIVYDDNALETLPALCAEITDSRSCTVCADARTWQVAGAETADALHRNGWQVATYIIPDKNNSSPVCDDITQAVMEKELAEYDNGILIAAGSGVVNDLTKWCAYRLGIRYCIVATAASMNGYTSANVAPSLKGVKVLERAQAPYAVCARPYDILNAPYELTTAGLGDVIAKPVSTADWRLNHALYNEHYCDYCAGLINEQEPQYRDHSENLTKKEPDAFQALFHALLYSGNAMTLMGTSLPASGGEHLFSHTRDMRSYITGQSHDLHGRQVGLGTLVAAEIYKRMADCKTINWRPLPEGIDDAYWGHISGHIAPLYAEKKAKTDALLPALKKGLWQERCRTIALNVAAPSSIAHCLENARAARWCNHIGCSREEAIGIITHMHEMRARVSIIDIAHMAGVLPGCVEEIIDEWLVQ